MLFSPVLKLNGKISWRWRWHALNSCNIHANLSKCRAALILLLLVGSHLFKELLNFGGKRGDFLLLLLASAPLLCHLFTINSKKYTTVLHDYCSNKPDNPFL